MGYQINGMEIEEYMDNMNKEHLKNKLIWMFVSFLAGISFGAIILSR